MPIPEDKKKERKVSENLLSLRKNITYQLGSNIKLSSEIFEAFQIQSRKRPGCQL